MGIDIVATCVQEFWSRSTVGIVPAIWRRREILRIGPNRETSVLRTFVWQWDNVVRSFIHPISHIDHLTSHVRHAHVIPVLFVRRADDELPRQYRAAVLGWDVLQFGWDVVQRHGRRRDDE